jgi:Fe2+ transport system protein FeoA
MQCPLCGYNFDEKQMVCHSSCAFNQACAVICCPNCGYQMTDLSKSRLASALRRALNRRRDALPPVRPLSALLPGECGKIVSIESPNDKRLERLHILGLVPEAQVTLEQRQPAFVLRVDFTEVSVERDIADTILVDVTPV